MYRIKGFNEKFESIEEFVDNLERGGEVEFTYGNGKYSLTHSGGKILFIKIGYDKSLREFQDIYQFLEWEIEGETIKDIVPKMQPYFRCF